MVVKLGIPLEAFFRRITTEGITPVTEIIERGKTIFFPGDPAERFYFLIKGAVKLSRVYETGEEITVALLRENSVFGVLSLLTESPSDRFYHAVAFTSVELLSMPMVQVGKALQKDPEMAMLLLSGLSSRILQTEMMIETLSHRDMSSRLKSFILTLCLDFGVQRGNGIQIDLQLPHQGIAEAIGSTRVTVTRLLGELRDQGIISIEKKKITVYNPILLGQSFT
jgi:CRP/FNR family transcriptional regulator, global nitrogen regulator